VSDESLIGVTLDSGRYRLERHLQGLGLQQLYLGRDTDGGEVLISYDKLPKYVTIEQFVKSTHSRTPGVLELAFAGPPDDARGVHFWGVVERAPRGDWLPSLIGQHPEEVAADPTPRLLPGFDAGSALPHALALGRSAGRILQNALLDGSVLAQVRPETMWAERGDDGLLRVTAVSQRSELMFAASCVDAVTWPVFDRYYYAPEVESKHPINDRALVFCLSIMIAEWATGCFPYRSKNHRNGRLGGEHVPLELPRPLAVVLSAGMRLGPERRPSLRELLAALEG
jgi:hypothetical protein